MEIENIADEIKNNNIPKIESKKRTFNNLY